MAIKFILSIQLIFYAFLFNIGLALFSSDEAFGNNLQSCSLFLSYPAMDLPKPFYSSIDKFKNEEKTFLSQISRVKDHSNFEELYQITDRIANKSDQEKLDWLACVYHYITQDFDGDGNLDWKIIGQNRILEKLIPNDLDFDQDGITNVMDEGVYEKSTPIATNIIPSHLQLSQIHASAENALQQKLKEDFGVLLVNYNSRFTKDYIEVIQSELRAMNINWENAKNPLVIYAFNRSSDSSVTAYYYPGLRSIGVFIGSEKTYLTERQKEAFGELFKHELGHEYIFNFLSPTDLRKLASDVGGWSFDDRDFTSFYDEQFLIPFGVQHKNNSFFPTTYSYYNTHEWFCENFSKNIAFLTQLPLIKAPPKLSSTLKIKDSPKPSFSRL